MRYRPIGFVCLGLPVVLAGCSLGGGQPETIVKSVVPASGKVLRADGRPAANVWVVFHAKDPPGNDAGAATAADGTFRLGTFGKDDGAVPGRYVVTVEPYPNARGPVPAIPRSLRAVETSPARFEVKRGGPNEFSVTLK